MKIITRILLSIIFILLAFVFILSINLRFQILNPNFWDKTFQVNGTYSALSDEIRTNFENQTVIEGGKKSDIKILTDLATPAILTDLINNNIKNTLGYINGNKKDLLVFIPISKVPKSLLPKNLGVISEETKLQDLTTEFNIKGFSNSQIQQLKYIGFIVGVILILSLLLLIITLIIQIKLTKSGKRFISLGISFLITGILISLAAGIVSIINTELTQGLLQSHDLATRISGVVIPPILNGITRIWSIVALSIIITGIVLIFVKKQYTKTK